MNNDKCIFINQNTELYDVVSTSEDYISIMFCNKSANIYINDIIIYEASSITIEDVTGKDYAELLIYDSYYNLICSLYVYSDSFVYIDEVDEAITIRYTSNSNNLKYLSIDKYPILTNIKINNFEYGYQAELFGYLSLADKEQILFASLNDSDFYLLMSKISVAKSTLSKGINKNIGFSSYLLTNNELLFIQYIDKNGNITVTNNIGTDNESNKVIPLLSIIDNENFKCIDSGSTIIVANTLNNKQLKFNVYNNYGLTTKYTNEKIYSILDIIKEPIYNDIMMTINDIKEILVSMIDDKEYFISKINKIKDLQENLLYEYPVIDEFNASIIVILDGDVYNIDRTFFENISTVIKQSSLLI